ncbi:MAG: hypothetical protein COU10_00790 [Candidatus Harrisonbacteria bacterium CG10_big_fil_rev_8_21_14_0_10_45_28]|uniref:Uncharacterized protein n=1 Tax=Candidatus Harrisonbacteria bacterium CG10_big_fil_rev_8_21_14_0_10_45_28 TaxID=1974586 RepID=A0A2H0UP19_9BACT|nr:MAG: hypothetical protein COU10_00790 [Candidatus Harrisonbacteria bacterium CG10_big_fil_rev_8_21_14_0_10_45_28]
MTDKCLRPDLARQLINEALQKRDPQIIHRAMQSHARNGAATIRRVATAGEQARLSAMGIKI